MTTRALLVMFILFAHAGLQACTCAASHEPDSEVDAAADGGNSEEDAAPDTGVDAPWPDGAVVARTCADALAASEGDPCAFERRCYARDLCCGAEWSCENGRLRGGPIRIPDSCSVGRETGCASQAGAASVAGDTPLGRLELAHGYASFTHAFAVDVYLLFAASSPLKGCARPRLGVWLFPLHWDERGLYRGEHDAIAQVVMAGEIAYAPARVLVHEEERSRLVGTISIDFPGFDVEGTFDVEGCDELDRSGP